MPQIELIFLGTGTSAGIPMIGCACDVCRSDDPRDRRMRPSVVVRYNNATILIDASPELRIQCIANDIKMIDAVVFTHAHADHIMGVDDLRRINAVTKKPLDIWANDKTHAALGRVFDYAFLPPGQGPNVFRPVLNRRMIESEFELAGERWIPIPLIHGDVEVLGFRIGNLAYCTDTSFIPEASFKLLEGVDTLVLDALQPKKHPTHMTIDEAVAAARRIGAKQTWFTHMTHFVKHETIDATLPDGVRLGYDGLRITSRLDRARS